MIVVGTLVLRIVAGRFRVEPLLLGKASTFMQILLGGAVLGATVDPALAGAVDRASADPDRGLVVIASAVAYVRAARPHLVAGARRPQ